MTAYLLAFISFHDSLFSIYKGNPSLPDEPFIFPLSNSKQFRRFNKSLRPYGAESLISSEICALPKLAETLAVGLVITGISSYPAAHLMAP